MLYLLKKLKLHTKMGPEIVHNVPISIPIKIYLWSFADYQHLAKSIFTAEILHWTWTTALSIKAISGVTLPENALGQGIF